MKTFRVTIVLKDKLRKDVEPEAVHQAITIFVKAKDRFSAKTKAYASILVDAWEEEPIKDEESKE